MAKKNKEAETDVEDSLREDIPQEEVVKKEIVKEDVVKRNIGASRTRGFDKEAWKPKTSLGMKVKSGEIDNIDYILDNRLKILEHEIVDVLMPNLVTDL
ncbi:MAG: hypothetical protein KKB21_05320, partial [Nanoarchaeota archaeon]|nr:hypothetical protein [Nanoarchaeota archaeon]